MGRIRKLGALTTVELAEAMGVDQLRILVGTGLNEGDAEYQNLGDVAMLQVTVARLAELWPDAEICVLTDSAAGLTRFCPGASAVSRYGAVTWLGERILLGRFHSFLPKSISTWLSGIKRLIRSKSPAIFELLLQIRFRLHDPIGRLQKFRSFLRVQRSCDLFVISGCGGFADSCREWNLYALALIDAALARNIRVALFGQQLGPLTDSDMLARMQKVLPRVDLIASRGAEGASEIAKQIGVLDENFLTTGDDAVEPAYRFRPEVPGKSLGINLRVASYSGVSQSQADAIGAILTTLAAQASADLVPLPIALHSFADDRKSIRRLMGPASSSIAGFDVDSPEGLYAQVARCRLVVTGAYHSAVFALAQGIPTVCIVGSEYYAAKFKGLRTLFGEGCKVIYLERQNALDELSAAISEGWVRAGDLRPFLLRAARSQIASSREAYVKVRNMFPCPASPQEFVNSTIVSCQ